MLGRFECSNIGIMAIWFPGASRVKCLQCVDVEATCGYWLCVPFLKEIDIDTKLGMLAKSKILKAAFCDN